MLALLLIAMVVKILEVMLMLFRVGKGTWSRLVEYLRVLETENEGKEMPKVTYQTKFRGTWVLIHFPFFETPLPNSSLVSKS